MNILIPHNWLLEHLDTRATPKDLEKYLSLCGPTVDKVSKIEEEPVYDIEVTPNRVDAMSVRGIAREATAILPQFNIKARLKPINQISLNNQSELDIQIVNDPKLCKRILAIRLSDVKIKPSPKWLKKRLIQVEQRPLNNVIDITNYVMWELGHPIHAFDYDKIKTKKIVVRSAKKEEKLVTLDNQTRTLSGGEVVFDNGKGTIIDLPGIMGTKNTVVDSNTKNVLLWIESIDSKKIRNASMNLSIRSQAAVLNEKHVDPELGEISIKRAVDLFQKLADAKQSSQLKDIYPKKLSITSAELSQKLINTYLGVDLKPPKISSILESLGCKVKLKNNSRKSKDMLFKITPPSWRAKDLQIPQDYIEEIARIYGYFNLPSKLFKIKASKETPSEEFLFEKTIKNHLADWGLQEVYTHSMVSENKAQQSGFKLVKHLEIKNPYSKDWVYLRRSMIPSHISVIDQNPNHSPINIFEIGNVYHPRKGRLPNEEKQLVITSNDSYRFVKGILDALVKKLFIQNLNIVPSEENNLPFLSGKTGEIYTKKSFLGYIGEVHNQKDQPTYSLQLLLQPFFEKIRKHPLSVKPVSTPPIIEDLTFRLPDKTYIGEVMEAISSSSKLVEQVNLAKTYKHNFTFTINYRHPKKTLTDNQVEPIRKKIVKLLESKYQAKLIGTLQ